jgi:hypothetical protein
VRCRDSCDLRTLDPSSRRCNASSLTHLFRHGPHRLPGDNGNACALAKESLPSPLGFRFMDVAEMITPHGTDGPKGDLLLNHAIPDLVFQCWHYSSPTSSNASLQSAIPVRAILGLSRFVAMAKNSNDRAAASFRMASRSFTVITSRYRLPISTSDISVLGNLYGVARPKVDTCQPPVYASTSVCPT